MFSGKCDDSRNAKCNDMGFCVCPDFMCSDSKGACMFSPSEIKAAVESGVQDITEKFSGLSNSMGGVPNADSNHAGWIKGALGSASTVAQSTMSSEGSCVSMVGTCVFSDCPESTKFTATCSYGVCKCKEGFCHSKIGQKDYCVLNLQKLLSSR